MATKMQKLTEAITSPSLPTIPFDLIIEILSRVPVKFLLQFRCVCKLWKTLISDPNFIKKHLRLSTTRLIHTLTYSSDPLHKYALKSFPLDSLFSHVTTTVITQLECPCNPYINNYVYFVGSCNGILCLAEYNFGSYTIRLWNPSIRKFKTLLPLEKKNNLFPYLVMYGFGYDLVSDNYKVVVVLDLGDSCGNFVQKHKVKVYTLGTNSWKSFQKFPFGYIALQTSGKFVNGTINWLVSRISQPCIVSLDLGNESYQEVSLPDYGALNRCTLHLGILRDCLCIVFGHDVWVMKEHGNKESWTKLFTISYLPIFNSIIKVVNIVEDDQILLNIIRRSEYNYTWEGIIYNSRNGTFKFAQLENTLEVTQLENTLEVCIESLMSPCF